MAVLWLWKTLPRAGTAFSTAAAAAVAATEVGLGGEYFF